MKDYNAINWHELVKYNEESPSCLQYVETVKRWGKQQPLRFCGANDSPSGWRLSVRGDRFMVHRIIWILHNGPIPDDLVVDHVNGNPFDNRIANLSLKTSRENNQNVKMSTKNTSGHSGVFPWNCHRTKTITAYVATWADENCKQRRKFFAFSKYTEQGALEAAIAFRKEKIQELIEKGMSYTSRHGTK